jgi:AraC-like DNA-binding protein
MMSSQDPTALYFGIPEKLLPYIQLSATLPEQYKQQQLPYPAATLCVESPAGVYLSQIVDHPDWQLSWQQGFIEEKLRLQPSSPKPALILYCMLKGNVNWRLQGHGKLMLIEKEFGIYYVPALSQNVAEVRPGHYEMLTITLTAAYFKQFTAGNAVLEEIHRHHQKRARRGSILPPMRMETTELRLLQELRQAATQELVQQLLIRYVNALSPRYVEGGEQVRKLRQICTYIQGHYHQPLSITDLSKRAGMHINTFERTFKELLGVSPRGYVEHLRMKKAAVLLSQTSLSIKEISNSTGYSGANYFTSVFRKHHRCSPREYRKNRLT